MHSAIDIIATKRDGGVLTEAQIDWIIGSYTSGQIPDEQMAALVMAIYFRGMEDDELTLWTRALTVSGELLNFSSLSRRTVDKHSTGGVGDKITLPLAPLVAACGVAVPQLSGRSLGHTGGTLDKLEAIPGWGATLSTPEILQQLESVGAVICAAGPNLAPADKRLYALRDVTGTVESIPLIASSIMSKKIAEGASAVVLDVKVGSGAFMKDLNSAQKLASTLTRLGAAAGIKTSALLTDMSVPLGFTAGNSIEVEEAVEVLAGGGPSDVVQLVLSLAREMLALVGRDDIDPADRLADGSAMDIWRAMIAAQGGDLSAPLRRGRERLTVESPQSGILSRLDAFAIGNAARRLGAGRSSPGDEVQAGAGVIWHARQGDPVAKGQKLFTLLSDDPGRLQDGLDALVGGYAVTQGGEQAAPTLIHGRVG